MVDLKTSIVSNPRVVVLFYRPTCPYCKHVLPLYEQAIQKHGAEIVFHKVDISSDSLLKSAFDFKTVPMFIYYKDGAEITRHGSNDMQLTDGDIESAIQKL